MTPNSVAAQTDNRKRTGRFRWTICALLFFATTINYIDRQILGILAPDLQKTIGWSESQYGYIVTAFQTAYALGLLLFGRFIDKYGTRIGYLIAISVWSVASMAHAAARTAFGFGAARFALGLGESGNFPCAIKVVAEWFPKKAVGSVTGLGGMAGAVGGMLFSTLAGHILEWTGSYLILFIISGSAYILALGVIQLLAPRLEPVRL